jgi:hypothetical protein
VRTIVLLSVSNIFMTFAWYGHLTFRQAPLYLVILVSWGIVFFEYCFQVPANRFGVQLLHQLRQVCDTCGSSALAAARRPSVRFTGVEDSYDLGVCNWPSTSIPGRRSPLKLRRMPSL